MSFAAMCVVASMVGVGASPSIEDSTAKADAAPSYDAEFSAEASWASRATFFVVPGFDEPLPSLGDGASATFVYRLRARHPPTFLSRRASLGVGLSASRWSGRSDASTDQAWRVGLPIDFRFDVLTGAVRPWLGFRASYDWVHFTSHGLTSNQLRFGQIYLAGIEVRPTPQLTLGAHGGYRLVDLALVGGDDGEHGMHWFELGAAATWRFGA